MLKFIQEKFEDTKGIIRSRKSKKDRQHNGLKKKDKSTNNNERKTLHIKLKIVKVLRHWMNMNSIYSSGGNTMYSCLYRRNGVFTVIIVYNMNKIIDLCI